MNTQDKVSRVINEIHGGGPRPRQSVQEVMDTLLQAGAGAPPVSRARPVSEDSPRFKCDTELDIWRENNNRLFQVNYYRPIHSRRRFIGRAIVFARRLIRRMARFLVEPIVQDQNEFNGSITASINAVHNNTRVFQGFMDHMGQWMPAAARETEALVAASERALRQEIESLRNETEALVAASERAAQEMEGTERALRQEIESLRNETEALRGQLAEARPEVEAAIDELYILLDRSELQALRAVKRVSEKSGVPLSGPPAPEKAASSEDIYGAVDYFDFENHFRGTRKNIRAAQSIYLPYFKGKHKVIDLGCGRGEFLELLRGAGIDAIGVDIYEDFVAYCQMKGLEAVHGDAVQYLMGVPESSVGGIFAAQVAEHLETRQLVELCRRAYGALGPGGCLIIETPNPTCLATYYSWFYVDPSHVKPVHPLTLEYFLKQAGFRRTQVLYTEQSKAGYRLPLLAGEHASNLAQFNEGMDRLSDILFGSMDYAVVAEK